MNVMQKIAEIMPQVKPFIPMMEIKLRNLSDEQVEDIANQISTIASAINE